MGNKPRQDKARQGKREDSARFCCSARSVNARLGATQGNAGLEATQRKRRQSNARRGQCKGVTLYGTRACQEPMDTPGVAPCRL